jgi:5-methylcytosine-specific restriction endonuclease McrA
MQLTAKEKVTYRRTKEWKERRLSVLERDNCMCQLCNRKLRAKKLHIHHKDETKYKDVDEINFLVTLCRACHQEIEHWIIKLNNPKNMPNKYTELMKQIVKDFTTEIK